MLYATTYRLDSYRLPDLGRVTWMAWNDSNSPIQRWTDRTDDWSSVASSSLDGHATWVVQLAWNPNNRYSRRASGDIPRSNIHRGTSVYGPISENLSNVSPVSPGACQRSSRPDRAQAALFAPCPACARLGVRSRRAPVSTPGGWIGLLSLRGSTVEPMNLPSCGPAAPVVAWDPPTGRQETSIDT